MRSIISMDTVQIELTNLCRNSCSNCTRFAGHREPYFMSLDQFKVAVDSMVAYPKMTGIQGGEPLLHPDFEAMCNYLHEKIPYEKCGLWTTLPEGFSHYREAICRTFKHIFINDHSRPDIMHHPPLVSVEEMYPDKKQMWVVIDQCWAQASWSASIYPNGAWFCEIAGSMSMLFKEEERKGWTVEPDWWWRIPADFKEQMEMFCPRCGFPCKVNRRSSADGIDDISQKNYDRLKDISGKIKRGKYEIYDFEKTTEEMSCARLAAYKDTEYRNAIAARYGIFTYVNDQSFWTPVLLKNWNGDGTGAECQDRRKLGEILKDYYGE